jgi:hypothetical protein
MAGVAHVFFDGGGIPMVALHAPACRPSAVHHSTSRKMLRMIRFYGLFRLVFYITSAVGDIKGIRFCMIDELEIKMTGTQGCHARLS